MAYGRFNSITGVVVWFNPTAREVDALRLYNSELEQVIIVDNSADDHSDLCAGLPNVLYIPCRANQGIARALNIGCERALQLGAEWVLTMDQDSRWDQQSLTEYITEAEQFEHFDRVAIFSPFHDCDGTPEKHRKDGRFQSMKIIMCSGNLLRLSAWQQTGGFKENFFIDCVDDEISCHLRQLGWLIIRTNAILLTHKLGNGVTIVKIIHHPYTAHPAWRYFYRGRNMLYMAQLYPAMRKYYLRHALKELKRLLLYDWTDKHAKLSNYLRGLWQGMKRYKAQ